MLVAGDFCPVNRLAPLVAGGGAADSLMNDLLPFVQEKELAIVNLECPLTNGRALIRKTGPVLKASPDAAQMLSEAGFGLVTLANNHAMDYGWEGLKHTLQVCHSQGVATVGAGKNLSEARKIYYTMVDQQRVAVLNFSENEFSTTQGAEAGANPMDLVTNYWDIQAAANQADYVFVIVHGGHEMHPLPSPRLKKTFRFYADAGASAVFGHHPHCYGGYEVYKNKPLFYSLGNFLFDDPRHKGALWHSGYVVEVSLKESLTYNILPYVQCRSKMGVALMKGAELPQFNRELRRLNTLILDDEKLEAAFDAYCRQVGKMYTTFLELVPKVVAGVAGTAGSTFFVE
ncbi:hypothetical protein JCM15548_14040 [Geofilum rubicundum JCM 15548]|uniref:Capsule synthesis protein CapA domain-containing protein n=2 Tax=Geofilum TaxID=1236988 RepID=A0A0E9M231_9BACT|nr:hypothetical protein JCM15548_14040 [Geofilum rubicundum JCM 15548]